MRSLFIFDLARCELRRQRRSFPLLVGGVMLTLLVWLFAWIGHGDYRARLEDYRSGRAVNQQALEEATVYSSLRPVVVRAPEPLALFERGVSTRVGDEVEVHAFDIPFRAVGDASGNPYLDGADTFDLTRAVELVVGLLALLLTSDGMVSTRASGRLSHLLLRGGDRASVLAGLWLGVSVALWGVLAAAFVPAIAGLAVAGTIPLDPVVLGRVLGLLVAYGVYAGAMALVGLVLSTLAPTAGRALAYAVLAWLVVVILWPRSVMVGLETLDDLRRDARSAETEVAALDLAFERELEALWDEDPIRARPSGHTAPVVATTRDHRTLRRLGSARYYDSTARYHAEEVRRGRALAEKRHALRLEADAESDRTAHLAIVSSMLSPGFLLERVAAGFAGTSQADQEDFLDAARDYRERYLADLDRRGIFSSWSWFTDDPPETTPWPSFLGLEPDEVTPETVSAAAESFRDEAVQRRVEAELARRDDPATRRRLEPPPTFAWSVGGPIRAMARTRGELLASAVFVLALVALALRSIQRFAPFPPPRSRDSQPPSSDSASRHRSRSAARTGLGRDLLESTSGVRWRVAAGLVVLTWLLATGLYAAGRLSAEKEWRRIDEGHSRQLESARVFELAEIVHPATRPPNPLGFVVEGGERRLPFLYRLPLSTWELPGPAPVADTDPSLPVAVGPIDGSFLLRVVFALGIFLVGHGALCGRWLTRDRLTLAHGARRHRLLVGRWAAIFTGVAAPFLVAVGLGLGALATAGFVLDPNALLKLAAFVGLTLWGLGLFTGIALFFSAFFGRADRALVSLMLFWVAIEIVVPAAAVGVAQRLRPAPGDRQVRAGIEAIRAEADALEGASVWRPSEWARRDDFAAERRSARLQRARWERQLALVENATEERLLQAELARALAYLSPTTLLRDAAERLVGAGLVRQRAFFEQAREHGEILAATVRALDAEDPESPHLLFFPRYLSDRPLEPDALPRFTFREPSLGEGLSAAATPLAGLALWTLLLWPVVHATWRERLAAPEIPRETS